MRETDVKGLPEEILSLKPPTYRRTVGVDHVTVTPADIHGNTCVILIVEHFRIFHKRTQPKITLRRQSLVFCSNTSAALVCLTS